MIGRGVQVRRLALYSYTGANPPARVPADFADCLCEVRTFSNFVCRAVLVSYCRTFTARLLCVWHGI